jgi:hypothetical protein
MRLEELPKMYGPETLSLMDSALEQAWRELKRRGNVVDADAARSRSIEEAARDLQRLSTRSGSGRNARSRGLQPLAVAGCCCDAAVTVRR